MENPSEPNPITDPLGWLHWYRVQRFSLIAEAIQAWELRTSQKWTRPIPTST